MGFFFCQLLSKAGVSIQWIEKSFINAI